MVALPNGDGSEPSSGGCEGARCGSDRSQRLRAEAEAPCTPLAVRTRDRTARTSSPILCGPLRVRAFVEEEAEIPDARRRLCSDVAMEPIWTSVVAVAGTLLGAIATYPFQRLAA